MFYVVIFEFRDSLLYRSEVNCKVEICNKMSKLSCYCRLYCKIIKALRKIPISVILKRELKNHANILEREGN